MMSVRDTESRPWATGLLTFAGALMLTVGIFEAFEGIAALANDDFFVIGRNYTYDVDITGWGWIHLILGVIVAVIGLGLMFNKIVARAAVVPFVVLSMLANFLFLPYYPFWSITIIAFNVFVLWAVVVAPTD